jgi:hypothetical protein
MISNHDANIFIEGFQSGRTITRDVALGFGAKYVECLLPDDFFN